MENKQINELNEVYDYLSSDDELYHHGVLGMKWGVRRFQPYSLIPRKSGKGGKETGEAKESKSSGSSMRSSKKKSRKQAQDEVKAQRIRDLQTARQRSEEKKRILKSGDAKTIYENREHFTTQQMNEAINRINTEATLKSIMSQQNPSKSQKMRNTLSKLVNPQSLQRTASLIENASNLYNQSARVANLFRDSEHQLKYIGKAENKNSADVISKAARSIINTGDPMKILENQSSFTDKEVRAAKDRLNDLASIRSQQKGLVKFDTDMNRALKENKKERDSYQREQATNRQERLKSNLQAIDQVKKDYGEGGVNYIGMTPSPQKPSNTNVTTSKDIRKADDNLFKPSTKSNKDFDEYFNSEVSKVNPYGDAGLKKINDSGKGQKRKKK